MGLSLLSFCRGIVYFIQVEGQNLFKIGYTTSSLKSRLKRLQTGCPDKLIVFEGIASDYPEQLEKEIHTRLEPFRKRGEWFSVDEKTIENLVWEYKGRPPDPIEVNPEWYVLEWYVGADHKDLKPFHIQPVKQMLQRNLRDAIHKKKQSKSNWIPIGFFRTFREATRYGDELARIWLLRQQKESE